MFTLFHHPFCPHSRFIRLALGEHALELRLVEERVWERREAFLALNPACTTPVLIAEGRPSIPGAGIISIDGIDLKDFDFIDIGQELPDAKAVPVVIKSLIFRHTEHGRGHTHHAH